MDGTMAPACRLASMWPGAIRRDQSRRNWKESAPSFLASMWPGVIRRDQIATGSNDIDLACPARFAGITVHGATVPGHARAASMRPGANAGINANSNGLSRRCPDMRASMRPGANRRDQLRSALVAPRSRCCCFNAARRKRRDRGGRRVTPSPIGCCSSMRPGRERPGSKDRDEKRRDKPNPSHP